MGEPGLPDLPGYEVLDVLGQGGFGVVYRARQLAVGREVAVKVDNRPLLAERDRRRFMREVTAAGSLSGHPHVADVYDAGTLADGRPYMVLELCPNGSLADRLRVEGRLPAAEVRDIGVKIADALAAAHAQGVLHRDVKPGNILINRFGMVALSDFGLAAMPAPGRELSVTLESLTPAFAPPEAFELGEPTEAGDVYALAATLYALLNGRPPRFPESGVVNLSAILALHRLPIPDIAGVPPELTAVLRLGMASDPRERLPTAAALRDALAAVPLDGHKPGDAVSLPGGHGPSPSVPGPHASAPSHAGAPLSAAPGSGPSRPGGAPAADFPSGPGPHSAPAPPHPGYPASGGGHGPGGMGPNGMGPVASAPHGPVAPYPAPPGAPHPGPARHGASPAPPHGHPADRHATHPPHRNGPGGPDRHLQPTGPGGGRGVAHTSPPPATTGGNAKVFGIIAAVFAVLLALGIGLTLWDGWTSPDGGTAQPGVDRDAAAEGDRAASSGGGADASPAASARQSAPATGEQIRTTTASCPAARVSGANAACPAEPECWSGIVSILGSVKINRRGCEGPHVWETFAIAPLPGDAVTWNAEELEAHPTVKRLCSRSVLLASRVGRARQIAAEKWQLAIVPPSEEAFGRGVRTLRCVGAIIGQGDPGSLFRPA